MSASTATTGYLAPPFDFRAAREIAAALELAEPVAIALVRRGHDSVEAARAFLAADETHDPERFAGIGEAVRAIQDAIGAGTRITVHGDYDVDGICATAILAGALRRAGAACDWLIPDRLADGYGLGERTLEQLRERGTGLLITVDCGIASPEEVERIKAAGIGVIVSDHHEPGDVLPDCPIVHPRVSGYPCPDLCGAAVAQKLASALAGARGEGAERGDADLDLVALATVADMVPLLGENRTLVRRGLAALRRRPRPGLRALMAAARVDFEHVDEGDIGFRLAPRLNAAGRLYRADAGVELLLAEDGERAAEIAAELDAANHERRATERQVSAAAEAALRELPGGVRDGAAIVVAGEGWHPGVVGIVASRLTERHARPAIVLSIEGDRARGSGRSVAGFDLLAALDACSAHLGKYGGHRAAAGLELPAASVDAFRADFAAHAAEARPEEGFGEPERIDAVVGAEALDLRVAEQLAGLAPFGRGNPPVSFLVPGARVVDVREMGEEGRHARFQLRTGGVSASAVAFNANGTLTAAQRSPHDLSVRLEVNRWNGSVAPRAVLGSAYARDGGAAGAAGESAQGHVCAATGEGWWERFDAELHRDPELAEEAAASGTERVRVDARGRSLRARITELLASGARVMAVAADAARRAALTGPAGITPSGAGSAALCLRCAPEELFERSLDDGCALLLCDWASLAACPEAGEAFEHLVLIDPPPGVAFERLAVAGCGQGYVHLGWSGGEDLAERCWAAEWNLRPALAEVYRALGGEGRRGEELRAALTGPGSYGRSPAAAARCARVLSELGLIAGEGDGDARWMGVVSSERTELERSGAWRAYASTYQEGLRFLQSQRAKR